MCRDCNTNMHKENKYKIEFKSYRHKNTFGITALGNSFDAIAEEQISNLLIGSSSQARKTFSFTS